MSSAEELQQMRRLVAWTLWKMGTDVVNVHAQGRADAEDLFRDKAWQANVVGEFAANHISEDDTIDWAAFCAAWGED